MIVTVKNLLYDDCRSCWNMKNHRDKITVVIMVGILWFVLQTIIFQS
jgi:hypothetical protein